MFWIFSRKAALRAELLASGAEDCQRVPLSLAVWSAAIMIWIFSREADLRAERPATSAEDCQRVPRSLVWSAATHDLDIQPRGRLAHRAACIRRRRMSVGTVIAGGVERSDP